MLLHNIVLVDTINMIYLYKKIYNMVLEYNAS